MRLDESDTESDMPLLTTYTRREEDDRALCSDCSDDVDMGAVQDLVEMHAVLVGPDTQVGGSEEGWAQNRFQWPTRNRRKNGRPKKLTSRSQTGFELEEEERSSCQIRIQWATTTGVYR